MNKIEAAWKILVAALNTVQGNTASLQNMWEAAGVIQSRLFKQTPPPDTPPKTSAFRK